ncbi:hypothetical protein PSTT_16348 [Puccinia striiformis]|uniref:Pantothenate kinase n=1 Tax=Puccinia striiformis TaxID=27350 RepID=A0A2S4UD57_9BASI|nr:hypothetical protein PSTT_16348 [Puccinia striiformis]
MSGRHLPALTSTLRVDIRGAEILDEDESNETSDIYLPKHTEFISHIALDIGGSLAKVVYFTRAADINSSRESHAKGPAATPAVHHPPSQAPQAIPEPTNSSDPRPHSSARSSFSQPNGILNPTVVQEELYNSRSRSLDPGQQTMAFSRRLSNSLASSHPLAVSTHKTRFGTLRAISRDHLSISLIPGGRLNFIKFETSCIESECITFISNLIQLSAESNRVPISTMKRGVKIILTGGGAYMYADLIKNALGGDVEVLSEDEMDCLITGLNFITEIPNKVFWFSDQLVQEIIHNNPADSIQQERLLTNNSTKPHGPIQPSTSSTPDPSLDQDPLANIEQFPRPSPSPPQYSVLFESNPSPQFPCMLVNIGSGVSIIKVTNFGKFERTSGTSLGGGTLWGLLSLLTEAKRFDEMLDLSIKGDNSKVDMLVGDIYGQDYGKIGLKSSTIASSFGKDFKKKSASSSSTTTILNDSGIQNHHKVEFKPEDISKSLLYAISNNIGQIAHLNAEKHGLDRIYLGGCFIRGYLGSIGAWLKNIGHKIDQASSSPSSSSPSSSSANPSHS